MAQSRLVLLTPAHDVNAIARFLFGVVGRGTFPMQQLADDHESCAFLFNDLLASDDDSATVATWILTADALTYRPYGDFGIRPEMTEDGAPSAANVIVTEYEQTWYHFPDIGVAAMPMAVLRDYSARKGWAWSTQEITDGLAASARDIASLGEEQHTVLVIGHPTDQPNRPQGVAVAGIDMRGGRPTLLGAVDRGFVGAPAFVAFPNPASPNSGELMIKCIGVVLPGDATHPIATFDKIRPTLRRIMTDELPPGVYPPRRPASARRWRRK
jgi:hypothetical protein